MNTGEYRIRTDRGDRGCSTSAERLRPHARLAPVGGAARRAPDDRRHGGVGHLCLRDTAPEVGEGVNSPRAVLGFSRA